MTTETRRILEDRKDIFLPFAVAGFACTVLFVMFKDFNFEIVACQLAFSAFLLVAGLDAANKLEKLTVQETDARTARIL